MPEEIRLMTQMKLTVKNSIHRRTPFSNIFSFSIEFNNTAITVSK